MTTRLTRRQAVSALAALRDEHVAALAFGAPEPVLVQNWSGLDSVRPWAIVWADGPDDWAYRAAMRHTDVPLAPGVGCDAATMCALTLFPA